MTQRVHPLGARLRFGAMTFRTPTLVALVALAGCSGKVLDGTCSPGDAGNWACEPLVPDASDVRPVDLAPCPANVHPSAGGSCSDGIFGGGTGFTNAPGAPLVSGADCLACGSGGRGTHWACGAHGWESQGQYLCEP